MTCLLPSAKVAQITQIVPFDCFLWRDSSFFVFRPVDRFHQRVGCLGYAGSRGGRWLKDEEVDGSTRE